MLARDRITYGPDEALATREAAGHAVLHPLGIEILEHALGLAFTHAFPILGGRADDRGEQIDVMHVRAHATPMARQPYRETPAGGVLKQVIAFAEGQGPGDPLMVLQGADR